MPFEQRDVTVRSLGANEWVLLEPLTYHGNVDVFRVPPGFVTDFASVPRIAVWLIPRFGTFTRAAILHDWLCRTQPVSPVDTDGIFRRVMAELGVGPVKRWLMWTGVRWSALTDSPRRHGWWRTAPAVIGITVLASPLALPMFAVACGLALYGGAEFIATGGRHAGTTST